MARTIPADLTELYRAVELAYSAMPDDTDCGIVRHAYRAFGQELTAQLDLLKAFVSVSFTSDDPYPTSGAMFEDIARNRSMRVYTSNGPSFPHAFAHVEPTSGQTYNSIFRAVHDGLAHFPQRNAFGPIGEHRAFLAHARILSPAAVQALATETLGQNAFYYVHGTFAPQKFGILSAELIARALEVRP